MSYYVPGAEEKNLSKVIKSLQQAAGTAATAATDIASLTAVVATKGTVTSVATAGLATGGPVTTTGTVTVTAATKSDQQTGTSTTTVVTPAQHQSHDSSAKAWVVFNASGTVLAGYNVTSVTKNAAGDFTVNFTTAFASANYACFVTSETGGAGPLAFVYTATTKTASLVRVGFENASGAALTDPTNGHVVCFGRQ